MYDFIKYIFHYIILLSLYRGRKCTSSNCTAHFKFTKTFFGKTPHSDQLFLTWISIFLTFGILFSPIHGSDHKELTSNGLIRYRSPDRLNSLTHDT